jgi:hypothetical protein
MANSSALFKAMVPEILAYAAPLIVFAIVEPSVFIFLRDIATLHTGQASDLVLPFTLSFALATTILLTVLRRAVFGLPVSIIYALSIALFSTASYEFIFDIFFTLQVLIYRVFMLCVIFFGCLSVKHWKIDGLTACLYFAMFLLFVLWAVFSGAGASTRAISAVPTSYLSKYFVLNIITKLLAFIAPSISYLRGTALLAKQHI